MHLILFMNACSPASTLCISNTSSGFRSFSFSFNAIGGGGGGGGGGASGSWIAFLPVLVVSDLSTLSHTQKYASMCDAESLQLSAFYFA